MLLASCPTSLCKMHFAFKSSLYISKKCKFGQEKVNSSQAKLYKIQKKDHWRKKVNTKTSCLGWVGGEHTIKVNADQLEPTCNK